MTTVNDSHLWRGGSYLDSCINNGVESLEHLLIEGIVIRIVVTSVENNERFIMS